MKITISFSKITPQLPFRNVLALGMQEKLFAWTLIMVLCACLRLSNAGLERHCLVTDQSRSSQGICGQKLSDILSLLCGMDGYHKRSIPDVEPIPEKVDNGVFIPKDAATAFLGRFRRSKWDSMFGSFSDNTYQGIVCECCHHRCSVRELMQYCRNPAKNIHRLFGISTNDNTEDETAREDAATEVKRTEASTTILPSTTQPDRDTTPQSEDLKVYTKTVGYDVTQLRERLRFGSSPHQENTGQEIPHVLSTSQGIKMKENKLENTAAHPDVTYQVKEDS